MEVLNFSSKRGQNEIHSDFAEREKIQGLKNLNVPNKREQSDTCFNSAERGVLRPKGNVPNSENAPKFRFPEFTEDWVQYKMSNVCKIATGNKNTQDKVEDGLYPFYVRSQNVERINSWTFEGEAILTAGDGVGVGKVFHYSLGKIGVHQRVYILSDFNCYGKFLFNYFSSRFYNRVKRMSAKNSVDSVRMEMIADMPISIPKEREQIKIGELLSLLDERIATQNKIIQQLQSLIKGIRVNLFDFDNYEIKYLGDLCSITTGKLDANAMIENGKYPFFTCAEEAFLIDEYAFDTEALLISGNGANLGYIHYYNGKFNAYQRTYVLDKFSLDIMYVKYYLETFLKKRINQEVNVGNTPYIVLSTLSQMKIKIPNISQQRKLINALSNLNKKLKQEKDILSAYQKQKAYLLRNLFI